MVPVEFLFMTGGLIMPGLQILITGSVADHQFQLSP